MQRHCKQAAIATVSTFLLICILPNAGLSRDVNKRLDKLEQQVQQIQKQLNELSQSSQSSNRGSTSYGETENTGYLDVNASGNPEVYVDGTFVGNAPINYQLSVGRHEVKLVNPKTGREKTRTVTINNGGSVTISSGP